MEELFKTIGILTALGGLILSTTNDIYKTRKSGDLEDNRLMFQHNNQNAENFRVLLCYISGGFLVMTLIMTFFMFSFYFLQDHLKSVSLDKYKEFINACVVIASSLVLLISGYVVWKSINFRHNILKD